MLINSSKGAMEMPGLAVDSEPEWHLRGDKSPGRGDREQRQGLTHRLRSCSGLKLRLLGLGF